VVEGQIIGGIAQGIGEALMEELVYDENGQPRTVTLADYTIPSALEIPAIELHHANTPSGALGGFKGCGEGSIIGAVGAVACAVADALRHNGGDIYEFPATPERVLTGLERVSRPGRRVYYGRDKTPPVLAGLGTSILTTSRGVMTGREAARGGVGGEVLCNVW